jgi:hypothetical protein
MDALKSHIKLTLGSLGSIQALERGFELFFQGVEQDVHQQVVDEVKRRLDEVRRSDRPSSWEQWIDGVKGAPIEHIRFNGIAYLQFSYLREIVEETLTLLRGRSPVREGDYQMGHVALLDDLEVYQGGGIRPDSTVIITNRMVYARRIENGRRKNGQPWSAKAPFGVYKPVAAYIGRKWARFAKVEFTFRPFSGVIAKDGESRPREREPAIVITPKWRQ